MANVKILKEGGIDYAVINNAVIPEKGWRNFSGRDGDRYFNVHLSEEDAAVLKAAGYNVKLYEGKNDSNPPIPYLKISIDYELGQRFPIYMPRILQTRKNGNPILLSEDDIFQLDIDIIERAKIKIRAYDWKYNKDSGRKAMLSKMYVTIYEDDFDTEFYPDESELPFA